MMLTSSLPRIDSKGSFFCNLRTDTYFSISRRKSRPAAEISVRLPTCRHAWLTDGGQNGKTTSTICHLGRASMRRARHCKSRRRCRQVPGCQRPAWNTSRLKNWQCGSRSTRGVFHAHGPATPSCLFRGSLRRCPSRSSFRPERASGYNHWALHGRGNYR